MGGTAAVYRSTHSDGRPCAVKVMHSHLAYDRGWVRRLKREAALLGSLNHPGLVSVLQVAALEPDTPFLVMELLEGRSLEALRRGRGGKLSFTHIIGYAVVKAAAALPDMNVSFTEVDGKPGVVRHHDVNLGLAIDLTKDDGTRQLVVPSIKGSQNLDFAQFYAAYEDIVRRALPRLSATAEIEERDGGGHEIVDPLFAEWVDRLNDRPGADDAA